MLTSIMRSLGYIPMADYVIARDRITDLQNAAKKMIDDDRLHESADKLRITDLEGTCQKLESALKRTHEGKAMFESIVAEIISGRENPQFAVMDDGKTLALQAVLGGDLLVIKSTVKNRKNLDHLQELARTLNLMMVRRSEAVARMVKEAAAPKSESLLKSATAPLDAPTGDLSKGHPGAAFKPKGFA